MRTGGERPHSAPLRVTRAIKYLGFRAEGHSGPGRQLHPQQPPAHAERAGTEAAASEVDDGPHVRRTSPQHHAPNARQDAASVPKLLPDSLRGARRWCGSDLGTGQSDMSGHRVQFADLPANHQKGGPKFHSKDFTRSTQQLMHVGELLKLWRRFHDVYIHGHRG